jgi:hypothetical protein
MKRVLLDHRVRPDRGHQLILADDLAFGSAEHAKDFDAGRRLLSSITRRQWPAAILGANARVLCWRSQPFSRPAAIVLTQAAGATLPGQIELQGWVESASARDVLAKSAQNSMQIAKRKVMK